MWWPLRRCLVKCKLQYTLDRRSGPTLSRSRRSCRSSRQSCRPRKTSFTSSRRRTTPPIPISGREKGATETLNTFVTRRQDSHLEPGTWEVERQLSKSTTDNGTRRIDRGPSRAFFRNRGREHEHFRERPPFSVVFYSENSLNPQGFLAYRLSSCEHANTK